MASPLTTPVTSVEQASTMSTMSRGVSDGVVNNVHSEWHPQQAMLTIMTSTVSDVDDEQMK